MKVYARKLALVNGSAGFAVSRQPDFSTYKIIEVPLLATLDQERLDKYLKEQAMDELRILKNDFELVIQAWDIDLSLTHPLPK